MYEYYSNTPHTKQPQIQWEAIIALFLYNYLIEYITTVSWEFCLI